GRAGMPAPASTAWTVAITGVERRAASVTTTTWSARVARTNAGSWAIAAAPKWAAGFDAITNASIEDINDSWVGSRKDRAWFRKAVVSTHDHELGGRGRRSGC